MKNKNTDILLEEESIKKFDLKKFLLIFSLIIVTLVGIFFLSTYIRWKAEIKEKNEILYYKQDEIKINSLKNFYDEDINIDLSDNQAILMYCSSNYGGDCVTGDFVNDFENLLRSPWIIINIVILIDLLILYFILRKLEIKKIYVNVVSIFIILYGVLGIGNVIYNFFDYYHLVNDTDYITDGVIVKGILTTSDKKFKPIVQYKTEKGTYFKYLNYEIKGTIDENINEKITLYYDYKNNEIVTPKRDLKNYILPLLVNFLILLEGLFYFKTKSCKEGLVIK